MDNAPPPSKNAAKKRAARVTEGRMQREAEMATTAGIPSQGQLMLPLMQALERQGGRARPKDLYDEIAARPLALGDPPLCSSARSAGPARRQFSRGISRRQAVGCGS